MLPCFSLIAIHRIQDSPTNSSSDPRIVILYSPSEHLPADREGGRAGHEVAVPVEDADVGAPALRLEEVEAAVVGEHGAGVDATVVQAVAVRDQGHVQRVEPRRRRNGEAWRMGLHFNRGFELRRLLKSPVCFASSESKKQHATGINLKFCNWTSRAGFVWDKRKIFSKLLYDATKLNKTKFCL